MPYASARLPNGKECGFTHCEVVLPVASLDCLSVHEIGCFITESLIPRVGLFAEYFRSGYREYFDSIEEFDAAVEEAKGSLAQRIADNEHARRGRQEVSNNYARLFLLIGRRDGFRCKHCSSCEPDLEIDHVQPIAKGGTSDLENLQLLCATCNHRKADGPDQNGG